MEHIFVEEYVDTVIRSGLIQDPRIIYDLTLPEIELLTEGLSMRRKEEEQMQNIRIGQIAALICNTKRTKKTDKVYAWTDFFPDILNDELTHPTAGRQTAKQDRDMTAEEILAFFAPFAQTDGGRA